MRKVSLLYYVVSTCATCLLHTEQSLISSIVLLFSEPHTELTVATCVTAIAVPQDNPCLLHSTKMEHCFFFFFFKQGIGKKFLQSTKYTQQESDSLFRFSVILQLLFNRV